MLSIHTLPIDARASYDPGLIGTREHLPGTESQARACFERFLESVGGLHHASATVIYVEWILGAGSGVSKTQLQRAINLAYTKMFTCSKWG